MEKREELQAGLDLILEQARILEMLPVEEWLEAFERADTTGPILDPTLYRDALYSGKLDAAKRLLRAALELIRTVHELRADVVAGKIR